MPKNELNDDRLEFLATQVAQMRLGTIQVHRLGNIAIELLIARESAEEKIEGDYPPKEKEKAEKTLKRIRELEKSLVQLYVLGFLQGSPKKEKYFDYIVSKYIPR